MTRKGRPTNFLFLLHLILGIPPAFLVLSLDFARRGFEPLFLT